MSIYKIENSIKKVCKQYINNSYIKKRLEKYNFCYDYNVKVQTSASVYHLAIPIPFFFPKTFTFDLQTMMLIEEILVMCQPCILPQKRTAVTFFLI